MIIISIADLTMHDFSVFFYSPDDYTLNVDSPDWLLILPLAVGVSVERVSGQVRYRIGTSG